MMLDDATIGRLQSYVADSNEVLELKLLRDEGDFKDKETSFLPEMSHQVFGDSETIFGYKDLKIKLYYSAGCLETYLAMSYSDKFRKGMNDEVEPDEVLPKLVDKLAPNVHDNFDSFIKSLAKDDTFRLAGELIHSFTVTDDENKTRNFEVFKADMTCKGFKEYHQRLQTFLLWYIDAASFIDIDDDQWHYFNMFEKYTSASGCSRYATVGFATVYQYYAYPNHTRPRIAQILVLPPFQGLGLGAHLLRAIYRQYIGDNRVTDITVEDPSTNFQRVRDYVDALNCLTLPSYGPEFLLQKFNKTMALEAREKFKINKRQARRIYEILRLRVTDLANEKEYREYRLEVKKRLNVPYKRERRDLKKLESVVKSLDQKESGNVILLPNEQRIQTLEKEYRALEEEYKKVIKRLDETSEHIEFEHQPLGGVTFCIYFNCNDVILCKGLSEKNESQEEYVKYLKTSGYDCRVLRTLSFEFINLDHLKECLLHPESYSGFIFTSPRTIEAVNSAVENLDDLWKKLPVFCVGPSTETLAKQCLRLNLCEGSHCGNSRELADYIVNKSEKNNKPLLYPCSEISRDTIEKVLTTNGIKFSKLNVYRTLAAESLSEDLSRIITNDWKIFVFFSPSVVEHILNAANKRSLSLAKVKSVAIGPVTAEALAKAGLPVAATAGKPDPGSLLDAIKNINGT
ncbi:histone acetyltransferase type B catalytic subunit isoform X3 [Microplitis mediator]|uniref:histone acetyltransferase type B catalytic subunit isoform X3 n=1 Tax=Microplitis mediator TaxID=375433 RepID=UPI002554BDB0|nr:histone acetyltransferase type B catalytic subunit isoform X3 [Microplitis mediator]